MSSNPQCNYLVPPTPEEITKSRDEALDYLRIAILLLGEKGAAYHLKELTRKRGGRKGSTRPMQDKDLLGFYDWLVTKPDRPVPIRSLPRWIGRRVHEDFRSQYSATSDGITARLRRVLKQRDDQIARRLKLREDAARLPHSFPNMLDPDWQKE